MTTPPPKPVCETCGDTREVYGQPWSKPCPDCTPAPCEEPAPASAVGEKHCPDHPNQSVPCEVCMAKILRCVVPEPTTTPHDWHALCRENKRLTDELAAINATAKVGESPQLRRYGMQPISTHTVCPGYAEISVSVAESKDGLYYLASEADAAIASLRAELAAAKANDARYKWIRRGGIGSPYYVADSSNSWVPVMDEALDAAIDSSIAAVSGEGK